MSKRLGGRAHDITIKAFERYKLSRYLVKGQFTVEEYVEAITQEAAQAKLGIFLKYESPLQALLFGFDSRLWEDDVLRVLKPRGGFPTLSHVVDTLILPLSPIRPHRELSLRSGIDHDREQITFNFWSKAIGCAVAGSLSRSLMDEKQENFIKQAASGGIQAWAVKLADAPRENYLD